MDLFSSKKVTRGLVVFTIASSLVPGTMCQILRGFSRDIAGGPSWPFAGNLTRTSAFLRV
jgi:hypothetical protein